MLKFEQRNNDDYIVVKSGEFTIITISRIAEDCYVIRAPHQSKPNRNIWISRVDWHFRGDFFFTSLEDAQAVITIRWNEWLDEAGLQPKQPLNDNTELLTRIERLERALHMRTQHTVNKGDTLSSIALLYYGDSNQWQAIYRANKHVIGNNPYYLNVGQVLILPRI